MNNFIFSELFSFSLCQLVNSIFLLDFQKKEEDFHLMVMLSLTNILLFNIFIDYNSADS